MFTEDEIRSALEDSIGELPSETISVAKVAEEHGEQLTLNAMQAKFLSELQVPLAVECGTISIQARELIDLVPGKEFQFPFDPQAEISLVVSGETVARAKFVDVDGILGVQITSVGTEETSLK